MPVTSTLLCGSWDCKVEYQSDNWEGYIVILLLQGLVKIWLLLSKKGNLWLKMEDFVVIY